MKFNKVLQEITVYNAHPYIPSKKETIYDKNKKRVQGSKTDKYMFKSKNNKFVHKKWGKYDDSQVANKTTDTDDAKAYKKSVKTGKVYLTKVNTGYKVKI
ncbi:MAG: hypothetical protein ACOC3V_04690 [bacterium]